MINIRKVSVEMERDNAVILFIYNRPEHTAKVLEGLQKNRVERLYVFADGPRAEKDRELVMHTRKLIDGITWCEVEKHYSEVNKGLAASVIAGVSKVFDLGYKTVTVLEDDCVPNEGYIGFMREAFRFYESHEDVMHVSGFGLPIKKYTQADVYLTPYPCSWGWGTWAKYWRSCDFNKTTEYERLLSNEEEIRKFNYAGEAFSAFLRMQLDRKVNSWLIRWYYHIYSNNGKCVWCYDSMIENKGFDGTGVHKVSFDRFNQKKTGIPETSKTSGFIFEYQRVYNPPLIREFRRYFIDKSVKERLKTVIYLSTGLILEPVRNSRVGL